MKPVLFSLGPLTFHAFGMMIALGVLASLVLMKKRARQTGFPGSEEVFDFVFVILLSGFLGARLYYVLQHFSSYAASPLKVFALWEGGLVFYGGLIGALLGFYLYLRRKKIPFLKGMDFILPFVALTQAFGRIGCFLNGCCYGKICDLPWAVKFPEHAHAVHPTQLYEVAVTLAIFSFLYFRYVKRRFIGEISILYFVFYGTARFAIEFFRGGNPLLLFWTWNQWWSALLIVICGISYFWAARRAR